MPEQLTNSEAPLSTQEKISTRIPINGNSILYMVVWYVVAALVFGSMILQYLGIKQIMDISFITEVSETVTKGVVTVLSKTDLIKQYGEMIPYQALIYAMILYLLGLFGIEGTRSVVKSFDITGLQKQAQCMPPYKHARLIQMLVTFLIMGVLGLVFTTLCSEVHPDFHLAEVFYGILASMVLLGYTDNGPKLANDIAQNIAKKAELQKEEKEEEK